MWCTSGTQKLFHYLYKPFAPLVQLCKAFDLRALRLYVKEELIFSNSFYPKDKGGPAKRRPGE
jgi:hypothetical protein